MGRHNVTKSSTPAPAFNPFSIYDVNEDFEVSGVWLTDPFHRMRIARAGGGNQLYNSRLDALLKPFKRAIQTQTLPKETDKELSYRLYAETVVKNWSIPEMTTNEKGKPIPKRDEHGEIIWRDGLMWHPTTFEEIEFNVDNVILTFRTKPELYAYVTQMANAVTTFRDEDAEEADVKN